MRARGMTLIEIIVVVGLLTAMMGIGAGAYWRMSKDYAEQGAASQVDVVIRKARNSARDYNAPAYVEINSEERQVVPYACRNVGMWHFQTSDGYGRSTGGGHDAVLRGVDLSKDGKIGKCVKMVANGYVDVGSSSDFDLEDGGYLEAYIFPLQYGFVGDNFVFYKNGSYSLNIATKGILTGELVTKSGSIRLKAERYHIAPVRWTKVAMAWDALSSRLLIDDTVVAIGEGARVKSSIHSLLIGHETASIAGLVDEVRVMAASRGEEVTLPPSYKLTHNAAPWNAIYFAGDGSLDMRYHAGPVKIALIQGERTRTVNVTMLGETIRAEMEKAGDAERAGNAEPTMRVLSPNGFDRWQTGKTATVTWQSTGEFEKVNIFFSLDGGNSFTQLIFSTPNDGSELVNVPVTPGQRCRIRVAGTSGYPSDASDSDFTIVPK